MAWEATPWTCHSVAELGRDLCWRELAYLARYGQYARWSKALRSDEWVGGAKSCAPGSVPIPHTHRQRQEHTQTVAHPPVRPGGEATVIAQCYR